MKDIPSEDAPGVIAGTEVSFRAWGIGRQIAAMAKVREISVPHAIALAVQAGMNTQKKSRSFSIGDSLRDHIRELEDTIDNLKRDLRDV